MTRILFISEHFNVAGTETFMLNVIRASMSEEFKYDILLFRDCNNDYTEEAKRLGCRFIKLTSRKESPLRYIHELQKFFKEHADEYNAVHWCGGAISSIAPLVFAKIYNVPVRIVHSHNSSCTGVHTQVLHSVFKHFLPCVCTHFFACSTLAAKFFFGDKNSVIIKNGIDVDRYKYNPDVRDRVRKELDIKTDEYLLGHVGRFEEVKNHKFLIEIFHKLCQTDNSYKLCLIGIGSLQNEIKRQVESLGLTQNVLFLNQRSDINELMQAMDCFIMPSLYEGLPFVLVEAQAASLPCVISDTINSDAALSPFVKLLPLEGKDNSWTEAIHESRENYIRDNNEGYVIKAGFSIIDTCKYLKSIYGQNSI